MAFPSGMASKPDYSIAGWRTGGGGTSRTPPMIHKMHRRIKNGVGLMV